MPVPATHCQTHGALPLVTVFTPTFNRRHTLPGVYLSLAAQTYRHFEWLIVDDGSTDATDVLVRQWQKEAHFPIRYFYQQNKGKHVAYNKGVTEARGGIFLSFDSDDRCVPQTLERFVYHWQSIPQSERDSFSGVTCNCIQPSGRLVGEPFPADVIDCLPIELRVKGEKWGVHQTAILRIFPFPEIAGEKFIAEGVVWNRIGRTYKIRFVNESLRIYEFSTDGLSRSSLRIRAANPLGSTLYYREFNLLPIAGFRKLASTINYVRFSLHAGIAVDEIVAGSWNPFLTAIMLPLAYLTVRRDRARLR